MSNKYFNLLCLISISLSIFFSFFEFHQSYNYTKLILKNNVNETLPQDVAASVNGKKIAMTDYLVAIQMLNEESRNEINVKDYQLAIDRLIEGELLFQYAMKNNILYQSEVNQKIIKTILLSIYADITSLEITEEELLSFYQAKLDESAEFAQSMEFIAWDDVKQQIHASLILRKKSVKLQEYIMILRNRSDIEYNNSVGALSTEKGKVKI
ncbi:MAG: hypothetical protein ACI9YH_005283 [Colwellia sp.]|jgi:hypothetical protein